MGRKSSYENGMYQQLMGIMERLIALISIKFLSWRKIPRL